MLLPREEFFLTTKVWITSAGYEKARASIEESMRKLRTDYLDLLLIHQPFGDYYGTYRAMEELYKAGRLRAIGVSNFGPDRYLDIQHFAEIKPAVNQIETHVFQQQKTAKEYLKKYGCQIESWGPFAEGRKDMFTNPVLTQIGEKYGKTAAQTALRFLLQSDVVVIPKSTHKDRMQQNFDLFDFTLTPEDMAAIDPVGLLTHYRKILRESRIEIFYVGSAPAEAVAEYISPLVSRLGGREGLLPPQTPFHPCPGQDVTETMEVSQGKLCMGFVTPIVNRDKEFPAMQVFNTVFGAGMTSKLFLNVREAMSLCYSIGSSYYGAKGILTVGAGIDFDKEQLTRDEILRQLDACRRGEITQEELTAGKEALLSSLRATSDSPGAIEGYYATAHLSGLNMTPERYMEVVEKVSLADVVAAARTVTLHSTYFLKGESQ